jgi:maleate isomerase
MSPARVGLMVPSSNTVMEPDFQRELAGVATVHTARRRLADPVTPAGERTMLDRHARPAAGDLGTLQPDLVVFGCTSAGSLLGRDGDARLRAELSDGARAPVLGILDAMGQSLRAAGAARVSVYTPYLDALNAVVEAGFAQDGFEVLRITGLGIGDNVGVGRVEPDEIVRGAAGAVAAGSDALAVACTNFRALEVREELEQRLGVPVVTANSAALDAVRRALPRRREA